MLPQAREFNQVNLSSNCTLDDDLEHFLITSNHYLMVQRLKCSFYSIISLELGWFVPLIQVIGVTGFVLTKLDGTSRGGCVVSVVDELSIPVKFVGVGEGLNDLQPFDAEAFVDALFP
jgi:hypothetical protein